jgi:hypothetical protein
MSHPSLPSLTVSALLVPLPFSSWIVRHSAIELAAQPTWMDNATSDHRPYLSAPGHDPIEPMAFPGEDDGSTVEEFSFRSAWELTRSLESLPPAWRSTYRRWNRKLSEEHRLSMAAGGAHRYAQHEPIVIHTPPAPPPPAVIETGLSSSRASAMRARLYRRLGVVRCSRTHRLARDPDSAWTTIGGLDRRIAWAHT